MVYQESMVMGLPIVIALNRKFSKLDDTIPQAPNKSKSFNKFKPDQNLLIMLLRGLMQSFPAL